MIKECSLENLYELTGLMKQLWSHHSEDELYKESKAKIEQPNMTYFLYFQKQHAIGFTEVSLRSDYVPGTDTSPVGYLEGIYVEPKYRGKGIAKLLLNASENWAKEKRCQEFASDCELPNIGSQNFHIRSGFNEVSRNIFFSKKI